MTPANCPLDLRQADAVAVATAVRSHQVRAEAIMAATLDRIRALDPDLNCFTTHLPETALAEAIALDQRLAAGEDPGPLAGVPFAVKDLFAIAGIPTLAGSKINAEQPPAPQDATAVARLKQAGAILVGALNMDEYAYGFVTENAHYGPTRNPHDRHRIAGGSSGGSAAAVAAGLVPLSLGSDTNGSIRVPAALCGIWGLKPTYGRLSRAGVFPFCHSLDHIGPLARSVRDLAVAFDCLQGPDAADPVCTSRPAEPCLPQLSLGIAGLRIAVAAGYFQEKAEAQVLAALDQVAHALGASRSVTLPETHRARAAAYLITATEGANLHRENLRQRPQDFDPATRDRFLAGLLVPGDWYLQAQRFRQWYRDQIRALFQTVDLILAPTTPCPAPLIGQTIMVLDGEAMPVRPNLGLFTQPLSFIGLPIISVPIIQPGQLPVGVQMIAAPYQEGVLFRAAAYLETVGLVPTPIPLA